MRAAVFALTLVVAASGRATAADNDGSARPFESRPTALYAVLGLGTPVGLVGAELEETILPSLSLSAGVGWGAANAPQGSAMLRGLIGGQRSKFTIGAGISGGQYKWTDLSCFYDTCPTKSGTVAWGNVEIGGEHRFPGGFALRYFGGYGHIIAGDLVCDPPATSCGPYYQNDGYNLIYTGIGVGYSF
jgi:hypothetical protein